MGKWKKANINVKYLAVLNNMLEKKSHVQTAKKFSDLPHGVSL